MDSRIIEISIDIRQTISEAFKKMSETGKRLFLVFDITDFKGVLSIGDIQRAIINNVPMGNVISSIMRKEFRFASVNDSSDHIKAEMTKYRMEFMPIVNDEGVLVEVVFWADIIKEHFVNCLESFNLPVVIMAGGLGTRMKPLTNVLPKPLIPINEKTIIEDIMDRFVACGSNRFFLSVNYKADFIRSYFTQIDNPHYRIDYFQEDKPLGTAGSLALLKGKISSTFFVSNCDIIIEDDYSQILKYHRDNNNEITLVTAIKSLSIPYGVVITTDNGLMQSISEKPEVNLKINTGMYILEPHLLEEIPCDKVFHITHLIKKVINRGGRVGCFPINDGAWTDIGNWEEYLKYVNR